MGETTFLANILYSIAYGIASAVATALMQLPIITIFDKEKPNIKNILRKIKWRIIFVFSSFVGLFVFIMMFFFNFAFVSSDCGKCKASCFLEQNGSVVMEAEHYTYQLPGSGNAVGITWRETTEFSGYTGDSALQALLNTNVNTELETSGPALLYVIKFQTPGRYYVYVRGLALTGDDDSIHVGLAGNVATTTNGIGLSFRLPTFSWQNESGGNLTTINVPVPGVYTFYVWMREDGTTIDKIWLSTNTNNISNDNTSPGPKESPCKFLGK
jgi:hypothetical protein